MLSVIARSHLRRLHREHGPRSYGLTESRARADSGSLDKGDDFLVALAELEAVAEKDWNANAAGRAQRRAALIQAAIKLADTVRGINVR